jgi:hypothetical protein
MTKREKKERQRGREKERERREGERGRDGRREKKRIRECNWLIWYQYIQFNV